MASNVTQAQADAFSKVLTALQTDSAALSSHVATQLRSLTSSTDAGGSPPSSAAGISLLALKNSTLLSYTQHLLLLSSHTLRGLSLEPSAPGVEDVEAARQGEALVRNLVKLRMRLEKMRPVEARAKNQIDRLLRAANEKRMGKNSVAIAGEEEEEADVGLLSFRPNPSAMLSGGAGSSRRGADASEELDDDPSSHRTASRGNSTSDGIYRPPRLAPVAYDPDARSNKSRDGDRSRSAARNASLMADLASSLSAAPHEQSSGGVGVDSMGAAASSARAKALARMQAYEEDNFTRLNLSRKEEKKRRRDEADVALGGAGLTGRNMAGRIGGGLEEELGEILRNSEARSGKKRKSGGSGARNEAYEELRSRSKREGTLQRARDADGKGKAKSSKTGGTFEIAAPSAGGKSAFSKAVHGHNKRQRAKGGA